MLYCPQSGGQPPADKGSIMKKTSNREKIRATAIELFKQRGYDAVTISEICKAAGCSNSTFYYSYGNKENVLRESLDYLYVINQDVMARVLAGEGAWEKLWILHEAFMDSILAIGPNLYRKLLSLVVDKGIVHSQFSTLSSIEALIAPLILQGQQSGEIRNRTPHAQLASTVSMLLVGTAYTWCAGEPQADLKALIRHHLATVYDLREDLRESCTR